MIGDWYFGRMAYMFFMLCEGIAVFVTGMLTDKLSSAALAGFLVYLIGNFAVLAKVYKHRRLSERMYGRLQMISVLGLAVWLCYAADDSSVMLLTLFLQSFLVLLFLDREMFLFHVLISWLVLLAIGVWGMPGISKEPAAPEYIFTVLFQAFITWAAINFIKQLEFQARRTAEQERSLDDMLKVVEVKRDEARAAAQAKSEFLSNMSHEIRTPINAVLGMNEMILRESEEKATLKYAANIESSGKMLLSLINDVLDFSKIESGRMDLVPVNYQLSSVINDLINMFASRAKEKQLYLRVEVEQTIPNYLCGDEVRIRQIVTNLLSNAVKYTQEGGITLYVDFRRSESEQIDLSFEVRDTGIGIRQEDKAKLFESFQRLDQHKNRNIEGTGLGLAITGQFIELMNGRIDVVSEYGKGSAFTAVIPQQVIKNKPIGNFKAHYERGIQKNAVYKELFHAPDARILIVDDNEMNLVVAQGLLKRTELQIDIAYSGAECIEKLRTNHYHALLLDHMMPEMDGVETLKVIKSEKLAPDMPVIALTANAVSGAREMYMKYGFQDYLAKPIVGAALERLLARWLPEELVMKGETENTVAGAQLSDEEASVETVVDAEEKSVSIVDEAYVKQWIDKETGLLYSGGSEEMYRMILEAYAEQEERYLHTAETCLKEEDWETYRRLVHDIKSTSLGIGARELSEEAKELELAAKDGRVEVIRANAGQVFVHYKEVLRCVKHLLEQKESGQS